MANVHYPHLFTPITVRGKRIKNRIASAPHCGPNMFRCGENGYSNFTETAVQYFGALARGGAGIVNTGHLGVDPRYYLGNNAELFNFFSTHSIHEHTLPVMHLMTDMIHSYGALASIELNHGGMFCTPVTPGTPLLWPSEDTVSTPNGPLAVKAMDEQDMHEVAEYFANAARIGKRGGFDVVNVHAGHDWLLGAFLSPLDNRRTDAYGGSVRNRARFLCMVLQHVRQAVGEDMLIEVRLSASELAPGGITLEDTVQTVRLIAPYVDIVQCSAGRIRDGSTSGFTFPLQYMERGCNTYLARRVRAETGVLVETVGGIGTPEMAEGLIKDGTADFVGMARLDCRPRLGAQGTGWPREGDSPLHPLFALHAFFRPAAIRPQRVHGEPAQALSPPVGTGRAFLPAKAGCCGGRRPGRDAGSLRAGPKGPFRHPV